MRIYVKAHPKAKKIQIFKKDEDHYEVWVREVPDDGRANRAILDLVSTTLGVPRSSLNIISGQTSRNKIIQIDHDRAN